MTLLSGQILLCGREVDVSSEKPDRSETESQGGVYVSQEVLLCGTWRTLLCLFIVHLSLCVVMGISE